VLFTGVLPWLSRVKAALVGLHNCFSEKKDGWLRPSMRLGYMPGKPDSMSSFHIHRTFALDNWIIRLVLVLKVRYTPALECMEILGTQLVT
jgi:hypothetical protein